MEIPLCHRGDRNHVREALRLGAFLVRSTLPQSLLDEAQAFLDSFFDLPPSDKADCRVPGAAGRSGYTRPALPTAGESPPRARSEMFHWSTSLPSGHPLREGFPDRYPVLHFPDHLVPGIGSALRELHGRMLRVQREALGAVAHALGAPPGHFDGMLRVGPVVSEAVRTIRGGVVPLASLPEPGASRRRGVEVAALRPRPVGIEFLSDRRWTTVDAPEGYALFSVGVELERLTGGIAKSASHRAIEEPADRGARPSLAQFCHPPPWAEPPASHAVPQGSRWAGCSA
ncbi:2-oxoglutarate and iron-dependent oxygenase domain-containing protein [Streptomyces sp. ZYX-F-203]